MTPSFHLTTVVVFLVFLVATTLGGFIAARWNSSGQKSLDQWGLGGRKFGILITWFLVGGDFYTAYTVIAIPALVYSVGAYGFFALPYTIIVYPFVFAVMPLFWTVCRRHGYITASDFVLGHYGDKWLAWSVAVTGLIATIPYIALQMVGIRVVIGALGLGEGWAPLLIAFSILAVYTYHSGIKAPAMLAFGKDIMIYIVVFAAVIWIPWKLGGYTSIFSAADHAFQAKGGSTGLLLHADQMLPYASMALGSALAGFMYPHTMTGILSSSSADTIRWNAILLPLYTILLGLIALLGYMALAANIHVATSTQVIPALFLQEFPDWFVGFSFAAIVIGALVPAAIMAVGCANIFTRNIWEPLRRGKPTAAMEFTAAKIFSLVVLFAALLVVIFLPTQYAVDLQLIGGIWILQIFPSVVLGLSPIRLRSGALVAGWLTGMVIGTWLTIAAGLKPIFHFSFGNFSLYIGLAALLGNLAISLVGSWLAAAFFSRETLTPPTDAAAS